MVRALLVVLGGMGLLAVIVGVALMPEAGASMIAVCLAGGAVVAVAYFVEREREKRRVERARAETERRIRELTSRPWTDGERLAVRGMAGWGTIILLLLAVLATWVAWHAFREGQVDPVMLGAAVLLLAFVLWGIFRLVPAWGRARIVLDRAGFVTPLHGRIGWKDVNGVMLKRVEHRGIEYSFLSLRLVAPRFEDFHWTERVLAGFRRGVRRNVIDVPLKYTGASPDEVVAVARFLRKQATGEDHDWDPLLSDAYHDAMRRLSMRSAPDPDSFAKEVRENPEAALHGMEQAAADLETASAEIARLSRRARRSRAWAVLLLCGMLAAGMYKIFSR